MNGYENNSDVNLHFYFKRALAAHSILSMDTSRLYPPHRLWNIGGHYIL